MEFVNRILVIFSIVSLVFTISVKASDPFLSQDEVKEVFGPVLDKAKESFGPVSSLDIDNAEEAIGSISSLEEANEAFGPISSSILEEATEAIGPITPSTLDDAKEALGPISPSTIDETFDDAKEALGPSSSELLDNAKDKFESWISQNKEDVSSSSEAQKEDEAKEAAHTPVSPSASSNLLDEAKEKFDSAMSFITQNKHSSLLEEAEKEFGPIASIDIDTALPPSLDDAEGPISSKEEESIDSLSVIDDEAQKEIGPVSSFDLEEASSKEPVVSPSTLEEEVSQTKEEISSEVGPISSFDEDAPSPSPTPPSTFNDAKKAIGSISSKALDAAKEKFGSISSLFSQNKAAVETTSSVYFDHDVALAIESLIKQGKSKSQLAIDEAKKQLSDGSVNMDKGKCVKNCMENFASCIRHLDKAMEDLRGRNSEFLTNDVSAVDGEISACQSCFLENQSPLKDLEEAIVKAARECLNVLDHSG